MTRKQTLVATQATTRRVGSEGSVDRARKRSAADQLLDIAARTEDPAFRQVLLRQVAQLREIAVSRSLRARRA